MIQSPDKIKNQDYFVLSERASAFQGSSETS